MSRRASIFGTGAPGGAVEYRGDLTPPVASYASSAAASPMFSRLRIPSSLATIGSMVVNRTPRNVGIRSFYVHGAVDMVQAMPYPASAGVGGVTSSAFQRKLVQLMDWQINPGWAEAGRPRNLGLSTRVPQLQTNVTGGPGRSSQDQRPLFNRVQTVQRANVVVKAYPTRGARG